MAFEDVQREHALRVLDEGRGDAQRLARIDGLLVRAETHLVQADVVLPYNEDDEHAHAYREHRDDFGLVPALRRAPAEPDEHEDCADDAEEGADPVDAEQADGEVGL